MAGHYGILCRLLHPSGPLARLINLVDEFNIMNSPLIVRVKKTVTLGIITATLYSLFVTALFIFQGAEVFEKSETSYIGVLLAYYAAGIICGVIIGILLPFTKSIIGSLVVYTIAAFFLSVCIISTMWGFILTWGEAEWVVCSISTVVFGIIGTIALRRQANMPIEFTDDP